jgi:hypothetical protein
MVGARGDDFHWRQSILGIAQFVRALRNLHVVAGWGILSVSSSRLSENFTLWGADTFSAFRGYV